MEPEESPRLLYCPKSLVYAVLLFVSRLLPTGGFFFFFFVADLVLRFSDFPKNASPVLELQSSSCRSLTLFLNLSPLKQTSILTAIIRFEGACQDEQRTRPHRKVQASLLTE